MAKVIRIGELPSANQLTNEDLFVINSFVDDRTYSITWADLVGNIKEISQPVFFARGSEDRPSIAFVDFNAGFYSPGPSAVAVTTNGTTRMSFDGEGNIDIGTSCSVGSVVFHSPTTFSCDTKFDENVLIDGTVTVNGDVKFEGELDFVGQIGVSIDGNLTVSGDVSIGNPNTACTDTFFLVYSESTLYCDALFDRNLQVDKDITIGGITQTGNLIVKGESLFEDKVTITNDVNINNNVLINSTDGSISLTKDLTVGGVISGDGSGITNLNIPGSVRFKGIIDLEAPPPGPPSKPAPQTGDLYITDKTGTVNVNFSGIGGQEFEANQFVFYTVDDVWALGSVQDSSGFVTLSGPQTITGAKTFTSVLTASGGINAPGQTIEASSLNLTNKAVSDSTVNADDDKTLTTKDYVDTKSVNSVADEDLTLGNYISGVISGTTDPINTYNGSVAVTTNIDGTPDNTPNWLVARDANGDFSAGTITADLQGRSDISTKVDVTPDDTSSTPSFPLFVNDGVIGSKQVHADTGFSYLPSTNTLTLSKVNADITGNLTGNADTATALETPRLLWSQSFDGTANVVGDMTDVGNIIPQENNTKDIGSVSNVWANIHATTFHGYLDGSASIAERTKEKITAGLHILSTNDVIEFDGSESTTWYVDTSSDNVPSKIVVRDLSGSFSSNVITANEFVGPLTGDVTGDVSGSSGSSTGNAASATALETPRTLWGQSFDGTSDVQGSLTGTGDIIPSAGSSFVIGNSNNTFSRIYVDTIFGNIQGNSGSADKVNQSLTRGAFISGNLASFDGSAPDTWRVDASSSNLPNFIVARDGNGDFEAGTILANFIGSLTGDVTGNVDGSSGTCTGNAATATALENARTLWGQSFDGTSDVSGEIIDTGDITPVSTQSSDIGSEDLRYANIYAVNFHGNLEGVADSAERVSNPLNRGTFLTSTYSSYDGSQQDTWSVDATPSNIADKIVVRDSFGNFSANIITANEFIGNLTGNVTGDLDGSSGSCSGNAATATKLLEERKLEVQISGGSVGVGSAMFDGSKDVEIVVPVAGILDLEDLTPLPD